jgi:hypothetical protein
MSNLLTAQRTTIPEALAAAGTSLQRFATVPSGISPPTAEVLRDADTVVRGVIGDAHSRLSDDQRDVETDYSVLQPVVLYQKTAIASSRPGVTPLIAVTLNGGTIEINGLSFTLIDYLLKGLPVGDECLLVLKKSGAGYYLAGHGFGAFGIEAGRVKPLANKSGFATEYAGMDVERVSADIIDRLMSRHP